MRPLLPHHILVELVKQMSRHPDVLRINVGPTDGTFVGLLVVGDAIDFVQLVHIPVIPGLPAFVIWHPRSSI